MQRATLNGFPVPCHLSLQQVQLILPQGVLGLHCIRTGECCFPEVDGSLVLDPNEEYRSGTSERTGAANAPSEARDEPGLPSLPCTGGTVLRHSAQLGAAPSPALNGTHFMGTPCSPVRTIPSCPSAKPRGKLILDRVHEHIGLIPIVAALVDTSEFQRLRMLKQVGSTFYIYPGACHTRFEHSVGVAHLAALMAKKLARRQPELLVTDRDVECVMVAGLCHDLGHGPFSHLFERIVKTIRQQNGDNRHYCHEEMSIKLLRRIFASKIEKAAFQWSDEDTRFVELMINGLAPGAPWPSDVGRGPVKRFLCEIVANKRSGIDVDKLDYFMRDSLCCYGRATVDCHINRLIASCQAMRGSDGEMQICFEEKMAMSLGDIFSLRAKLHKHAYLHRVARAIDLMFADALMAAEPYFTVRGPNGPLKISDAVEDVDGFCLLGDWIFDAIAASPDPHLEPAQKILHRIHSRDLYSFAGTATLRDYSRRVDEQEFLDQLLQHFSEAARAEIAPSIVVDVVAINYGSSDSQGQPDDPIKSVSFFNPKSSTITAQRLAVTKQSPLFRPQLFGEKSILLFVRDKEHTSAVVGAFDIWRATYSYHLIDTVPVSNVPQTPGRSSTKSKRPRDDEQVLSDMSSL